MNRKNGFTLVEISIVLVIIGLLAGGILAGRDLIKAAQIRATVSQKTKYDTAVHTFETKYNALPGDISGSEARAFGLFAFDNSPAIGYGDDNGLVQSRLVGVGVNYGATGETLAFWRHLSEASLIDGRYGNGISAVTGDAAAAESNFPDRYMPNSKFSNNIRFRVAEVRGINYYWMSSHNTVEINGQVSLGNGMSPFDAYTLDQKMDDGMPNRGAVLAAAARCSGSSSTILYIDACHRGSNPDGCISGGTGGDDPNAVYPLSPPDVADRELCGLLARIN